MTMMVYRVRSDGTTTMIRERHEVAPADPPPPVLTFPPCTCPRCGSRKERSR